MGSAQGEDGDATSMTRTIISVMQVPDDGEGLTAVAYLVPEDECFQVPESWQPLSSSFFPQVPDEAEMGEMFDGIGAVSAEIEDHPC